MAKKKAAKRVVGKPKSGGGMTSRQKATMTVGEKRMAKAGFKTGGKRGSPTLRQVMRAGSRGGGG